MNPSSHAADATSPAGIDRTAIVSDGHPVQPADDDLDLLAESGRKITKLTVVLMAAVLAGIAFVGGVLVQKQVGDSSSGFPGGGGMSAMGGGMPGGYSRSGGGMPNLSGGYGGGGGGGRDAGQGTSAGASSQAGTPVVVGTVTKISGRTLTVKNFADESVTVKVPKGTTISDSSDSALGGLVKGVSVSVAGEKASDGTVTATSITAN